MKEKKLPQNMIRIDDEDLADLAEEIVEFIPELREFGETISVMTRYIPGNDGFISLNDVDTTSDIIVVRSEEDRVGIRKIKSKLHVIYCPEIYPLRTGDDTVIPEEILIAACGMSGAKKEVVRYVFRILHELGHIYGSVNHIGYNAELMLSIDDMMHKMQDYEYEKYKGRVSKEEMQAAYRYRYGELFADQFAYKWLPPVLTDTNVISYFNTATEEYVRKRNKEV